MSPAPWDAVAAEDQLFVLVTGANSGIGLGICQRLVDDFLAERSLSSHLTIITTTRSATKSTETTNGLRGYLARAARSSRRLRARAGPSYNPEDTVARVHLVGIQLDLCNLPQVYGAADQLVNGTVAIDWPAGGGGEPARVRIPRLDAVFCNAGMGGWTGLDWLLLAQNFATKGWVQAVTYPTFKAADAGLLVDPITGEETTTTAQARQQQSGPDRLLGQVFCANVFGHYVFGHELLPLLSRRAGSPVPPGRIIWESSVEAVSWGFLSPDDIQAVRSKAAYESTKRLTDVLVLTADLPGVRAASSSYFGLAAGAEKEPPPPSPPKLYLTHPGIVSTPIFPLNLLMYYAYMMVLYVARWLGSPWHVVTPYKGACAPVWVALQPQSVLDAENAVNIKWGSATTWTGRCLPKKTEVEGWGWEGRVEDRDALARDPAVRVLRKAVGRKAGLVGLTREKREDFEALGAECWRQMEALRLRWQRFVAEEAKKTP